MRDVRDGTVILVEIHDITEISEVPESNFKPELTECVAEYVENKGYLFLYPNSLVLNVRDNMIQLMDLASSRRFVIGFFPEEEARYQMEFPAYMLN